MIREIAVVAYPCRDVASTRAWYERVLGLAFAGAYVEDGVEKYDEAHLGSTAFGLMAAEWLDRAPGTASGVFFEVDDLEASIRTLHERGVTTHDRFDGPVCTQVVVDDPEGNRVVLHQRKPGRSDAT